MIRDAASHVVSVVFSFSKQSGNVVIIDAILNLVSLAPDRLHKSPVTQNPEVVGSRGFTRADRCGNVADTEWATHQRVQDPGPIPVSESLKGLDYNVHNALVRYRLTRSIDRAGIDWQKRFTHFSKCI